MVIADGDDNVNLIVSTFNYICLESFSGSSCSSFLAIILYTEFPDLFLLYPLLASIQLINLLLTLCRLLVVCVRTKVVPNSMLAHL